MTVERVKPDPSDPRKTKSEVLPSVFEFEPDQDDRPSPQRRVVSQIGGPQFFYECVSTSSSSSSFQSSADEDPVNVFPTVVGERGHGTPGQLVPPEEQRPTFDTTTQSDDEFGEPTPPQGDPVENEDNLMSTTVQAVQETGRAVGTRDTADQTMLVNLGACSISSTTSSTA